MKLNKYIREKLIYLVFEFFTIIFVWLLLLLFKFNTMQIMLIESIIIISYFIPLFYEYMKKKTFYNTFKEILDNLDKKYLITDIVNNSNFLDGKILLEYLYDIDKSFHEEVNKYRYNIKELKEYIELWCHEIKTPIATSKLIIDNNSNDVTKSILEEMDTIENYVEQVLYYSKSETVEKDYIIVNTKLLDAVNNVIKKNKKSLISKKIKIELDIKDTVKSDSKWLEFIINQIILNSIKYSKNKDSYIKIYSVNHKNNVILSIEDNGIGVNNSDLEKVFEKGFTGKNGRKKYNSTGIGLYLCKKLCDKLGHEIKLESIENTYTKVMIIFPNNSMTNLTEM